MKLYKYSTQKLIAACLFMLSFNMSCKKLVQIDPPVSSITTSEVFADSADAGAAVAGIYSTMSYPKPSFGNSMLTLYPGLSADELLNFNSNGDLLNLSDNTVLASNGNPSAIWTIGYTDLYEPNAILEGLQASSSIAATVKDQFTGEALWFRAFINFYLVNLFGDIPLVISTDYKSNAVASRTSISKVYQSVISDLKEAQSLLAADYSAGGGERIRVNKWAATALLARAYLYTGVYDSAEAQATSIINETALFNLDTLNGVFLKNSTEAILQWQNNSSINTYTYNATAEAEYFIPTKPTNPPMYYLTSQIINAFETGDSRKIAWIDSTIYNGVTYYYPYKYKVGPAQAAANATVKEYYTVLRLAEQYLIRAEARAQQNTNLMGAIADLNVIRERANLPDLSSSLNQFQVLAAVAQERRIELFAESGHRWLDLKRTGQVAAAFSNIPNKSAYQPYQQLYPVPLSEMLNDPNLMQNPGY